MEKFIESKLIMSNPIQGFPAKIIPSMYSLHNQNGEALYSQQKQDRELTVAQIMNSLLSNSDLNWRK